jgi:ribose transport system ATP-binding protein
VKEILLGAIMDQGAYLETKSLVKVYPGVQALDSVSLSIRQGEVHAIVGENGAGKSTLIKILSGAIWPDSGEIVFAGLTYKGFISPQQALQLGISTIYQEFNLVRSLSIAENVFLGKEPARGPFTNFRAMYRDTERLFSEMGIAINPKKLVSEIGVAYQQIVEIVKSVSANAKVMIMDEPSAPLTNSETEALFKLIHTLQSKGVTIVYISHRLEEIFYIGDRVSVMRDGRYIKTLETSKTNKHELISLMVGRELGDDYPPVVSKAEAKPYLAVKDLTTDKLSAVSFEVCRGEIVGLGGLVGAGRTEVVRALFGADPVKSGSIFVDGKPVNIGSPNTAIKHGIVLIPEDRKNQGLVLGLDVKSNVTIASIDKISRFSFVSGHLEDEICSSLQDELRIKTPSLRQKVRNLSGGNQQKVVLAKWLAADCDIILFDEPTRGIDVGTKQEIYNLMRDLAAKRKCIIMVSSEMPELIGMSDRIYVMHEGSIAGELRGDLVTQEAILSLASGQNPRERIGA